MFPKGYYFYTIWTKCVLGAYAYQELVPGQHWSCNLTVGCCQIEEAIVLSGGKSFNGLFSLHSDEEYNDCMSDNDHNLHQPGWEQCRVKINFFMHARSGRYLHTFVCKLQLSPNIFNNPIVVMRNGDAESILLKVTNLKSITGTDLCKCLFTIVTCWLVESLVCTTNTIMYHMLTWSEERSRHILQQLQLTTRSSPPGFLSWWWLSDML